MRHLNVYWKFNHFIIAVKQFHCVPLKHLRLYFYILNPILEHQYFKDFYINNSSLHFCLGFQ